MLERDFRNSFNRRIGIICFLFFLLAVAVVVKQGVLQMCDRGEAYTSKAIGQQEEKVVERPVRGTIYDRLGQPLATSTMRNSIAVAPALVKYPHEVAEVLCKYVHIDPEDLKYMSPEELELTKPWGLEKRIRKDQQDIKAYNQAEKAYNQAETACKQAQTDGEQAQQKGELERKKGELDRKGKGLELYFYLKRKGTDAECAAIRKYRHDYIERQREAGVSAPIDLLEGVDVGAERFGKRFYPQGRLASHLLGFVDELNCNGLEGIEASYNNELGGSVGIEHRKIDSGFSPVVAEPETIKEAVPSANIHLTIDSYIQHIAEEALHKALTGDYLMHGKKVAGQHAKGGICIVMDAKSGEVLAMATAPDFDPLNYFAVPKEVRRNRAICDAYEPGSIFKTFTAAAALKNGAKPGTVYSCPTSMEVDGCPIGNAADGLFTSGSETLADIIKFSFNTGTSIVALDLGKEKLAKTLDDFGFGHATDIGLQGEGEGILGDYREWSKIDTCTRSFGQAGTATPIQLVSAMQAVANAGVRMQPRIIKSIVDNDGNVLEEFPAKELNRPISPENANDLKEILCTVLDDDGVNYAGTGAPGAIPGYRAAGKTGTAQVVDPVRGGYAEGRYNASFLGFAPADDPRVVVLVKIEDPAPIYFGGTVAGPIWRYVCEHILPYLGEAPTPGYMQAVERK